MIVAMGQVTASTNALNKTTTAAFTVPGRNSAVVDPTARRSSETLNDQGWVMSATARGGGFRSCSFP